MRTLILSLLFFSSTTFANTLTLSLGEAKLIPLSSSQVWIQDRDVLTAEIAGASLKISGRKEGATHLKVGATLYDVQIIHPTRQAYFEGFQKITQNCVGLDLTIQGGQITVQGTLYRLVDWLRISEYAKKVNVPFQMQIRLNDDLKRQIQNHIAKDLEQSGAEPQNIIFEPLLEVRTKDSGLFNKQQKQLGLYGNTVTKDENSINIAPTIKVEITVAEIKKDKSLKYGLKWPATYDATLLKDRTFQVNDLAFSLSALEHDGTAKILASPNIIARSGEQAEFVAGGEFPIKIVNYKMQDIIWKKYGILLRVKPKADSSGRMSISIETEVSTIDAARSIDGIPGLLTNRVSSHFDLSRPQTIALSGLLKNEKGNSYDGLPGLARLPILGALFSSKDFKDNRSELVIFVRPSILSEGENNKAEMTHLGGDL